jgi:hypothetical protein
VAVRAQAPSQPADVWDKVALGDAVINDVAFHSMAFDAGAPDKALVGLEILQRFVVRFDFDRRIMTLTRPDAFTYSGVGAVIPFHFQDNQPEVTRSHRRDRRAFHHRYRR